MADTTAAGAPTISVVVPAHNEAGVIERTLRTMLADADERLGEVIVVCNGCTDDTADRARAFGDPVRVVEVEKGSKPLALNTGDEQARFFPRFFVDADISVPASALIAAAGPLGAGTAHAGAPALRVDTSGCSAPVRWYYDVWTALPYVTQGLIGSGVYGLSETGRSRFERFPDIIGDDAYVRRLFAPNERASVDADDTGRPVSFSVYPPRTLAQLVHIETRRRTADGEMDELFPSPDVEKTDQKQALMGLAANPLNWPKLAVYLYVKLESRRRYRARKSGGQHKEWLRDESSRGNAPSEEGQA